MKKNVLLFVMALSGIVRSQTTVNDQLFAKGGELIKARKDEQAFPIFQMLLKSDSANVHYLQWTAFLYSRIGFRQPTDSGKKRYYYLAEYLAKKAIALDEKSADAHFAYALALGRFTEGASSKDKLGYAKLIKKEAERVIELNPKHAGAWHVLGRWHREIANINAFEKAMINSFYGGMPPGASYEKAVECFKNSTSFENEYILHKYELANTYYQMGNEQSSKTCLKEAMALKRTTPDDQEIYKKCEVLLKKLD